MLFSLFFVSAISIYLTNEYVPICVCVCAYVCLQPVAFQGQGERHCERFQRGPAQTRSGSYSRVLYFAPLTLASVRCRVCCRECCRMCCRMRHAATHAAGYCILCPLTLASVCCNVFCRVYCRVCCRDRRALMQQDTQFRAFDTSLCVCVCLNVRTRVCVFLCVHVRVCVHVCVCVYV